MHLLEDLVFYKAYKFLTRMYTLQERGGKKPKVELRRQRTLLRDY